MTLLISKTQEQVSGNFPVEFKIPGKAAGVTEWTINPVFVERRRQRCAGCVKNCDGAVRIVLEGCGKKRNAIVKEADAALHQSFCVLRHRKKKAEAWSRVPRVGDGVVVETQAGGQSETRKDCPAVSD